MLGGLENPPATDWFHRIDVLEGVRYYDNCRADVDDVLGGLANVGLREGDYVIRKGWFNSTVPALASELQAQGIAVLRLDGDWYASTMDCLVSLVPRVSKGGIVMIDDYYVWDGCTQAVHDYFAQTKVPFRIRDDSNIAYFVK